MFSCFLAEKFMQIDDEVFLASLAVFLAGKFKHIVKVDFLVISCDEHCNKKISSQEKLLLNLANPKYLRFAHV